MEVRLLDVQDCVKMDVAIACFVRSALRELGRELAAGRLTRPPQAVLAADLRAAIRDGSRATVQAPHLREAGQRPAPIRDALHRLLRLARRNASEEAEGYLELVGQVIEQGSLSERIAARLQPKLQDADAFTEEARRIWIELADCLLENRPWAGRALLT
jgi:gamma-glutamyl:cysteine ligase YbdK (ATP-grasp superfamily)